MPVKMSGRSPQTTLALRLVAASGRFLLVGLGRCVRIWGIADVQASESAYEIRAGKDIGAIDVGTIVQTVWGGGSVTSVAAGSTIGSVWAGKDIAGTVTAGSTIGSVSAGKDIAGTITAGTFIGGAYIHDGDYYAWRYATYYGGVSAGRDILGAVTAGQDIVGVSAGRHINGDVTSSGGDIWSVHAGTGYYGEPDDGDYGGEYGGDYGGSLELGNLSGSVTATRDIHSVRANGDIPGAIKAEGGFVYEVNAGGSITGGVSAATDIGIVTTRTENPDWRPFYYYYGSYQSQSTAGVIAEEGGINGLIEATSRDIVRVSAGKAISGTIVAARDINSVRAGQSLIANVTAGRDIGYVSAGSDGDYGGGLRRVSNGLRFGWDSSSRPRYQLCFGKRQLDRRCHGWSCGRHCFCGWRHHFDDQCVRRNRSARRF